MRATYFERGCPMIVLSADDPRVFMNTLIRQEAFDNFLLYSLDYEGLFPITLHGDLNSDFLGEEDKVKYQGNDYISWQDIRPFLLNVLKLYHMPQAMRITLTLTKKATSDIQARVLGEGRVYPVQGFSLNITYVDNKVKVTTGTNYAQFTLDKTIEQSFDQMISQFFKKNDLIMVPL